MFFEILQLSSKMEGMNISTTKGLAIIIAAAGLVAFFAMQLGSNLEPELAIQQNAVKQDESAPDGELTPIPENGDEKTSALDGDWSEYNNEELGFSFWYPSEWGIATEAARGSGPHSAGPNNSYLFDLKLNGNSIILQKSEGAAIYRSFQVPSWCSYNSSEQTWAPDGEDNPQKTCESQEASIEGVTAIGFDREALGLTGYTYSILTQNGQYLFTVLRAVPYDFPDGDFEGARLEAETTARETTALIIQGNKGLFLNAD